MTVKPTVVQARPGQGPSTSSTRRISPHVNVTQCPPNLLVLVAYDNCLGYGGPPALIVRVTLPGHLRHDCQMIASVANLLCDLTVKPPPTAEASVCLPQKLRK